MSRNLVQIMYVLLYHTTGDKEISTLSIEVLKLCNVADIMDSTSVKFQIKGGKFRTEPMAAAVGCVSVADCENCPALRSSAARPQFVCVSYHVVIRLNNVGT